MVRSRSLALPLAALAASCCFVAKPGAPPRLPTAELAVALAAAPSEAWAKGGAWGPLEGKASSHSTEVKEVGVMILKEALKSFKRFRNGFEGCLRLFVSFCNLF